MPFFTGGKIRNKLLPLEQIQQKPAFAGLVADPLLQRGQACKFTQGVYSRSRAAQNCRDASAARCCFYFKGHRVPDHLVGPRMCSTSAEAPFEGKPAAPSSSICSEKIFHSPLWAKQVASSPCVKKTTGRAELERYSAEEHGTYGVMGEVGIAVVAIKPKERDGGGWGGHDPKQHMLKVRKMISDHRYFRAVWDYTSRSVTDGSTRRNGARGFLCVSPSACDRARLWSARPPASPLGCRRWWGLSEKIHPPAPSGSAGPEEPPAAAPRGPGPASLTWACCSPTPGAATRKWRDHPAPLPELFPPPERWASPAPVVPACTAPPLPFISV